MTTLIRILTVMFCIGLFTLAQAHDLIRVCPSSTAAGDGIDPLDLIWDVAGGTTSQASYDLQEFVLGFVPDDPESTCVIDGTLFHHDSAGNQVATQEVTLDVNRYVMGLERTLGGSDSVRVHERYAISGMAEGCTANEAASFSVSVNHLKSKSGDDCIGSGCAETQNSEQLHPNFRKTAGKVIDLQCTAAAGKKKTYAGEGINPLDLIWDLGDGTTSQSTTEKTELVIFITPRVLKQSCPEASVHYRAKVTLSFKYATDDSIGNTISDTIVLDENNPLATVSLPYQGSGERLYRIVSSSAQVDGCSSAKPSDFGVYLNQVNALTGETLSSQRLGAVVRKAVPSKDM